MRDYSLWLIPSDEQRSALKELMKYRPSSYRKNPRSYSLKSFPHFEPHITLASVFLPFQPSLDMLLPSSNPEQVTAKFESLRVGHTSLSVTLEKTRELMALHHAIDAHLKLNHIENSSGRSPHIPLFYLDEADSGDRQALKEELQEKGLVKNTGEGLLLNPVGAAELTADEIWLMDCTGEVAQWKWLERRDLVLWNRQKAMPGRRSFSLPIPRAPPIPPFKQNKSHGDEHTQFPSTKSTRWPGPDLYDGIYLPAYMDSPDPTSVSVPPIGWNVSHTDGRAQSLPTESTSSTRHPFMAMPQVGEESPWLPSAEYSNEYPPMGYPVMAMPQAGEESPWLPSAEYSNEYPPEWGSPHLGFV
ncbi:hypothetical protein MVEN_01770400 [Mycena venus]|uniref:Uncharacterized protein n=1 Tax=Mycena venus TaxID=2733690 RepID=A0A8H6XMV6_9AGAR|nr:hypothetical protein MVEN_01770400 [Mycena venus]